MSHGPWQYMALSARHIYILKLPWVAFLVAILWMKNAARNKKISSAPGSRVVNLRLDKLGRAGPFPPANLSGLGRAGRARILAGPGRAVQAQNFCGPGRAVFRQYSAKISPILRHFLKEQCLILNELIIKFKFSVKNLMKIRIEIKLGMTGPARPRISALQRFTTLPGSVTKNSPYEN